MKRLPRILPLLMLMIPAGGAEPFVLYNHEISYPCAANLVNQGYVVFSSPKGTAWTRRGYRAPLTPSSPCPAARPHSNAHSLNAPDALSGRLHRPRLARPLFPRFILFYFRLLYYNGI